MEKRKVKSTFVVRPPDDLSLRKREDAVSRTGKDAFPFVEFPTLCPIKFGNPKVPKSFVRSLENREQKSGEKITKKKHEEDGEEESILVSKVIVNVVGSTTTTTTGSEDDDTPGSSSAAAQTTTAASADEDGGILFG